jgi:pimeloyl-ACP methyl ester carboxylesterase
MSTQKALPGSPRTTSSVTSLQISTPVKAKVMYAVQQPLHLSTFDDVMGTPAWKSLPSWYLVAENDEVIPPDAERQFAQRMGADTIEVASGHCAMVYHPEPISNPRGSGRSESRKSQQARPGAAPLQPDIAVLRK